MVYFGSGYLLQLSLVLTVMKLSWLITSERTGFIFAKILFINFNHAKLRAVSPVSFFSHFIGD